MQMMKYNIVVCGCDEIIKRCTTEMFDSIKIRRVGVELFRVNGRTDRQTDDTDETNSRFSQFCERA